MKKLLLIIMVLCTVSMTYSQKAARLTKEMKEFNITLTRQVDISDEILFENNADPGIRQTYRAPVESVIGETKYDLQSNRMLQGRIYQFPDGTIGAAWTRGVTDPSFPDRGTGYNYFDGAEWGPAPTERIESVRTGWPAYAPWGPNGEIVFSHDFTTGLYILKRENKGTGDWEETLFPGATPIIPSWPRVATGGDDNDIIHLIYNSKNAANDQVTALLYARSTDGGETWDPSNLFFEEFGPNYYSEVGGDSYAIAAKGSTVAILISDTWKSDMALLKSTDNGESWEHTIIWEHPYPFYDWDATITDTFASVDGSAGLAIDNNGKVHVVFGLCRVQHAAVGNNYSYWPYAAGIGYWNEDMPTFSNDVNALLPPEWEVEGTELVDEYNRIGYLLDTDPNIEFKDEFFLYRTIGLLSFPGISIDNDNNIFLVYSGVADGYMNATYNYRHIWARGFANNIWGDDIVDLNTDIIHVFDECIFPVVSPTSDDNIHVIYQTDQIPGLALDTDHAWVVNSMYYAALPKEDLLTGIKENKKPGNIESVSQNFPNPFSKMTTVAVNLVASTNLRLAVTNLLGQEIMTIERKDVPAGVQYFEIDATSWDRGVYFYTITAGRSSVTKKMIVR
jgi:hypothetical protein